LGSATATLLLLVAILPADGSDVSLCSLLREPKAYSGREVTLTAGYRVGFEWQELACATCNATQRVWVEFDTGAKGARKLGKFTGKFDSLFRVRVRGLISERGHYGHSNGYGYQFLVREVLSAERVWQMTPRQPTVPASVELEVCRP
jgi:hypothetical protein